MESLLEKTVLDHRPLEGVRILILEDEFLIAMDVEQLCRDHGAADVYISRSLEELGPEPITSISFDAAVVDMKLGGASTFDFARQLLDARIPFVFATGYADATEFATIFPGVDVVGKPYLGADLIAALSSALQRRSAIS